MTDIPTGLAISSDDDAELATPQGFRLALAGLLQQSAPGVPVSGVLHAPNDDNGGPLEVTGDPSSMVYHVNAGVAVIARTGQGVYLVANPSVADITTAGADGTNGRIDIIFICQPDPELSDDAVARVDVVSGDPSATPLPPDLPAGALELSRKLVAAGATNTSAGAAFTNLPVVTGTNTVAGGIDASEIISGVLNAARIPSIAVAKISDSTTVGQALVKASSRAAARNVVGIFVQSSTPSSPASGDLWFW